MLPQDILILPSYLNTLLRDRYASLAELCDDLDEDKTLIMARMAAAGWHYDPVHNQFLHCRSAEPTSTCCRRT